MAEYRTMRVSFWDDPYIESLQPLDKLLYIYLFTNPHVNNLGILDISHKKIAFETGLDVGGVASGLSLMENDKKVVVDGSFIFTVNFIKHQTNTSPKILLSLKRQFEAVERLKIKKELCKRYPQIFGELDTVSIPSNTVSIPCQELEGELEEEDNNRVSPLPPKGGEGPPHLPASPEDDPDSLAEVEISSLNDCTIEFQDLAEAYQSVGGCVDVVPAYKVFEPMRRNFPLARIVDDLEQRKDCDQWRRGKIPKLSNYLTGRVWLNPIPTARASPTQPSLTPRQQQTEMFKGMAQALKRAEGVGNGEGYGGRRVEGALPAGTVLPRS